MCNIPIPGINVPGFRSYISDRLALSQKKKKQRLLHFDFNIMSPISAPALVNLTFEYSSLPFSFHHHSLVGGDNAAAPCPLPPPQISTKFPYSRKRRQDEEEKQSDKAAIRDLMLTFCPTMCSVQQRKLKLCVLCQQFRTRTRWDNRKWSQLGRCLFPSDVSLAFAVVIAKAPYC